MAARIRIPEPCTESWDAMPAVEGGRFCAKCAHQVPDLSQASDPELVSGMQQGTLPKCARFSVHQLDRVLQPSPYDPVRALQLLAMSALMVLPAPVEAKKKPKAPEPKPLIIPDPEGERFIMGDMIAPTGPHLIALPLNLWSEKFRESRMSGPITYDPGCDPPPFLSVSALLETPQAVGPDLPRAPKGPAPSPKAALIAVIFRRARLRAWNWRSLFRS